MEPIERAPESYLPLKPAALQLLLSLAGSPKHGWAIMRDVSSSTEGKIELSAGTLYGLIRRLGDQGLITESNERPPKHWDDERRRYYELTKLGRGVAEAELQRLSELLAHARTTDLVVNEV